MSGSPFQVRLLTLEDAVTVAYIVALPAKGAFLRRRAGMCGRRAGA